MWKEEMNFDHIATKNELLEKFSGSRFSWNCDNYAKKVDMFEHMVLKEDVLGCG